MNKLVFELRGLSCAGCAQKIENSVGNLEGVNSARLVFATQILNVSLSEGISPEAFGTAVVKVINSVESGIEVSQLDTAGNSLDDSKGSLRKKVLNKNIKGQLILLAISLPLFTAGLLISLQPYELVLCLSAYLISGYEVLLKAFRNIAKGRIFDENFLMTVATIGALATGQYPEAAAVMLFYKTGMIFQNIAVDNSRKSIKALIDLRPEYANLRTENGSVRVSPESVDVGAAIVIKPGEKIPLDCIISSGESFLDTSAITGEAIPVRVKPGDTVLSGSINKGSLLSADTLNTFKNSQASRILELVQNAASKKTHTENFIARFASIYTPVVTAAALLIAVLPPILSGTMDFGQWIYKAMIFLVISCPCALVVSIPLTFFAGLGRASAEGILIKGGSYLEALANISTAVFDKTGTLTKGVFRVTRLEVHGCTEEKLMEYAALAEAHSSHPIARSILESYGKDVDLTEIVQYEDIPGFGVKASTPQETILAGNERLMDMEGVAGIKVPDLSGTVVHIAVNGIYMGFIVVSDVIKADSVKTIEGLRQRGISRIIMLTGDGEEPANAAARELGMDEVYFGLLPKNKLEILERIKSETKGSLMFAGDGINDAPVLAGADIGVSMGALGSDAAIEASDIVLMNDEPSKLLDAIDTARKTKRIATQNIILAIGVKFIFLLLGTAGAATMWEAVFADVGVTLLAVINALRVIRK